MVLKLTFAGRLEYCRNEGAVTPKIALRFKALGQLAAHKIRSGAGERTNLEPAHFESLLGDLEEWAAVLKSDPEVIHRLSIFAAAAGNECSEAEQTAPESLQVPPSDPSEPAP